MRVLWYTCRVKGDDPMRTILNTLCFIGLLGGVAAPVWASDDSRITVFGKKAEALYLVSAQPVFDGTGYASQTHLAYAAPSRPGLQNRSVREDYYRAVWQLP